MIVILGGLILAYVLYTYITGKSFELSGMGNDERQMAPAMNRGESVDGGAIKLSTTHPEGENSDYANASGLNTDQYGLHHHLKTMLLIQKNYCHKIIIQNFQN